MVFKYPYTYYHIHTIHIHTYKWILHVILIFIGLNSAVMRIMDFDDEDSLICTVCGQSLGTGGGGGPSSCSLGGAFPEERSLVHKASESKIKRSWSSKLLFFYHYQLMFKIS